MNKQEPERRNRDATALLYQLAEQRLRQRKLFDYPNLFEAGVGVSNDVAEYQKQFPSMTEAQILEIMIEQETGKGQELDRARKVADHMVEETPSVFTEGSSGVDLTRREEGEGSNRR